MMASFTEGMVCCYIIDGGRYSQHHALSGSSARMAKVMGGLEQGIHKNYPGKCGLDVKGFKSTAGLCSH